VLERSDEGLLVQAGQDTLLIEDFRETLAAMDDASGAITGTEEAR
jgi:hypothetical protein